MMEAKLDTMIADMLLDIGVNPRLAGYDYLKTGIKMVYNDRSYLRKATKKLYPDIAAQYNKTGGSIERGIRHSIERLFDHGDGASIDEYFGSLIDSKSGKVTNMTFIAVVIERLTKVIEGSTVNE